MNVHHKINYVEYPSSDITKTKQFFASVFGWNFEDYGPDYTAFTNEGLDGGFFRSDATSKTKNGAALIVFYSSNLEKTESLIKEAGAPITKPIFAFPGGRRFHFEEPCGNEFAVWSDK